MCQKIKNWTNRNEGFIAFIGLIVTVLSLVATPFLQAISQYINLTSNSIATIQQVVGIVAGIGLFVLGWSYWKRISYLQKQIKSLKAKMSPCIVPIDPTIEPSEHPTPKLGLRNVSQYVALNVRFFFRWGNYDFSDGVSSIAGSEDTVIFELGQSRYGAMKKEFEAVNTSMVEGETKGKSSLLVRYEDREGNTYYTWATLVETKPLSEEWQVECAGCEFVDLHA